MEINEIKSAYNRAVSIGLIEFVGPFSLVPKTGPSIAARNYCLLLDASDERDLDTELVLLDN